MPLIASRWRVRLTTVALGLLALLAGARAAEACSCMTSGPPCQEAFRAKSVFVATVLSIEDVAPQAVDPAVFDYPRRVRMRVTEAFTGVSPGEIVVGTGQGGGDCGYPFTRGETYVVYAYGEQTAGLGTGICSRTKHVRDAAEDLAYLRSFTKAPASEGRISGDAVHWEYDYSTPSQPLRRPVPDLRIVIENEKRSIEAKTGRDGRFEVRAPVGTYRVRADPPAGTYVEVWPSSLELKDPRGCSVIGAAVHSDGHIAGQVVDARGEPVPHLTVQLGSPQRLDSGSWAALSARTGADGRFDIGKVPPGSYLVGFNTERDFNGRELGYPRAFLPGVTDPAKGEVIDLGPGQRVMTSDFVVPSAISFTTIAGTVIDQDGRRAVGAKVFLQSDTASPRSIGASAVTDANGRFALAAVEGHRYRLIAEARLPPPTEGFARAEAPGFVATAGADSITLRLAPVK